MGAKVANVNEVAIVEGEGAPLQIHFQEISLLKIPCNFLPLLILNFECTWSRSTKELRGQLHK